PRSFSTVTLTPVSSSVSRAQHASVVSPHSQNPPGSAHRPRNGGRPLRTSSSLPRPSFTNASTVNRGSFLSLKGSVISVLSPLPPGEGQGEGVESASAILRSTP